MSRSHRHIIQQRKWATWKLLCGIASVLTVWCFLKTAIAGAATGPDSSVVMGRQMFFGNEPLLGVITGHADFLPSKMVSCASCHTGTAGSGASALFAPVLNRPRMTSLIGRRGGPPSMFSASSFCKMLRTGVDPAYVLIARSMPRYRLSDDQCLGLWRYVVETGR